MRSVRQYVVQAGQEFICQREKEGTISRISNSENGQIKKKVVKKYTLSSIVILQLLYNIISIIHPFLLVNTRGIESVP